MPNFAPASRPHRPQLPSVQRGRAGRLVACVLALGLLFGCKVTEDQVKTWGDEKDAHRLSKVVSDSGQKINVRMEAAWQLVRIERFFALEKALNKCSTGDRHRITDGLVKRLMPKLKDPGPDESGAVKAKDGLFSAWYFARPKQRRIIEDALIHWVIHGPHGSGGDHKIQKIIKSFGRRGANLLAAKVPVDHPQFFVYDKRTVVSPSCLLGYFWKIAGPATIAATARRYMKAARADPKLALKHLAALLCAIGALGGRQGADFLADLIANNPNILMKAGASVGLRISGEVKRENLTPAIRDTAIKEIVRMMGMVNQKKPLPIPTVRGVSYLEHLFEIITKFKGDPVFNGLMAVVTAPNEKLGDEELTGVRTFLRLLTVAFMMRLDPVRALKIAYAKLPVDEEYPRGYLLQTVLDTAVYLWKQKPKLRQDVLKGLRAGLGQTSWVGKIIAVEGLALKELLPREKVASDIAALRKLAADPTPLKGSDWDNKTLGVRAKKAVEVLTKTK